MKIIDIKRGDLARRHEVRAKLVADDGKVLVDGLLSYILSVIRTTKLKIENPEAVRPYLEALKGS